MAVVEEEIGRAVSRQLGICPVKPEHLLMDDLGAESVDLVSIIATINDKLQIAIEEYELLDVRTVADLYNLARHASDHQGMLGLQLSTIHPSPPRSRSRFGRAGNARPAMTFGYTTNTFHTPVESEAGTGTERAETGTGCNRYR
jgi:acyl carrier protein